ncbi:tRNA(Ile)-lysidine synthetase [Buchnera aphidicola (Cinara tujafilina)]|uniref:tRNA(Ile)-lysidine synthase n=1 Tax=Buchnera aphidicola (Cinara tujafilina) TaxID=261317 RepID=F7WZ16_9GAMM|nr:tRNA lysidine(34) synthetase TilS [Buchnera aphidicola]AEH39666.1 tRNA(Ile)-lysidine synthetase [Buchnera aphidicola (Cinara tujafilina)]
MIKNLFIKYPENTLFLIALSGGIDSVVLLFQLLKWKKKYKKINIRAIHINHNLNKNSKRAEEYCSKICKKHQIPLIITDIPKQTKYLDGPEQYFRNKRYKIFKKFLLKNEILLTAHHLNDQCENIFLSFKRRRGISGLSGIKFSNIIHNVHVVRPLLNYNKKQIISWAKKKKLKWIEDKTNKDITYDRNFIRYKILNTLDVHWPYFLKNCAISIEILSKEREVLDFLIKKYLLNNMFIDGRLYILKFKNILNHLQYSLLKLWLFHESKIFPNFNILYRIKNEIIPQDDKKNKKIIFHQYIIYKYHFSLYCIEHKKDIKKNNLIWKNLFFPIKLPENLGFLIGLKKHKHGNKIPYPKTNEIVSVNFQTCNNIYLNNKKTKKKNKKYMAKKQNSTLV